MDDWSDVTPQDPWGPSHDKSGWQPTVNPASPAQAAPWTTWGRSDSGEAGGGAWGGGTRPWETKPRKGIRGDSDSPRKLWGHDDGYRRRSEVEEEEEEEEDGEEDGDSGWGDGPHWTTTLQDNGGFRSHWTKWGRAEGGPLPPIPPSAIKKSQSIPQPSNRTWTAQKRPHKDHAGALNRIASSSTHQRIPSHRSRPPSTRSQPRPHTQTSPQAQWRDNWVAAPSSSSDGLSYTDDEPPPAPPVQQHRLPSREDYFTPKSPYTPVSPSRTLAVAMGLPSTPYFASPDGKDPRTHKFISSDGAALSPAYKALYSKTRRAEDRLLWAYNPDNDERVKSALWWIHKMSEGIGGFGVSSYGPS